VSEAQRLKAIGDENGRLKLLVGELNLHGEALKAVIRKKGWSLPVKRRGCVRLQRVPSPAVPGA
jgi:hypothetical protein